MAFVVHARDGVMRLRRAAADERDGERETEARVHQSGLTCTFRNFTTPAPYCSANGPRGCFASMASAVLTPLSVTVMCGPCARISYVFHLPAALICVAAFATLTMAPVAWAGSGGGSKM